MLRVTWEWIGLDEPALDVANTVAISAGLAHDLLEPPEWHERWQAAAAASPHLAPEEAQALGAASAQLLALREPIREVFAAVAADKTLPEAAVAELNRVSRAAASWHELSPSGDFVRRTQGSAVERLLAAYARSAIKIAAEGAAGLRVCPAPSCGMFYRPRRQRQRWCSQQCGTRARVARHYRPRRSLRSNSEPDAE